MKHNKWILSGILLAAISFAANGLAADKLRINVGYWPGNLEPELEDRFFKDDLLLGTNLSRYDLEWNNKHTDTIYPLGLQYFIEDVGPGDLVLGGNYIRYQPDYEYAGLTLAPALYLAELEDYKTTDWEGEVGYRYPVVPDTLYVTPRVGYRQHFKEFNYSEFSIGNGTLGISLDSPFYASASGTYLGLEVQFYVMDQLSIIGDYISTVGLAGWDGSMNMERTTLGFSGNTAVLAYENAESGYTIDIQRWMLGIQYDITPELHIQTGVREETLKQSYPGYFGLPLIYSGGRFQANTIVEEFITDYIFYEESISQKKGMFFVAVSYDLNL
ncbi:MAG: hypothetical protein KDK27_00460 [Leptospiraceae bacterium]|nr:hypothetical protein [Leptospiraceae bacterium]